MNDTYAALKVALDAHRKASGHYAQLLHSHASREATQAAAKAVTLAHMRLEDAREENNAHLLAVQASYVPKAHRKQAASWARNAIMGLGV